MYPERACAPGRTLHVICEQMTNISELWVQMGNVSSVKDGRKFLPIHELCSYLSEITNHM
jgi:hypothetical protein